MAKDTEKETRHITVGDEQVPFEAVIGRNVPERVEGEQR